MGACVHSVKNTPAEQKKKKKNATGCIFSAVKSRWRQLPGDTPGGIEMEARARVFFFKRSLPDVGVDVMADVAYSL